MVRTGFIPFLVTHSPSPVWVTISEFRIYFLNLNLISLYQSGDYTLVEFGASSDDTTTTQTLSLAFLCPLHTHPGNWIYLSRRGQPVRARKRKERRRSLRDRKSDGDGDGDDDGAVAVAIPPHHPEDQLTATSSAKDTGNCWHCLLMFMEFPAPSVVVTLSVHMIEGHEYLLVTCRHIFRLSCVRNRDWVGCGGEWMAFVPSMGTGLWRSARDTFAELGCYLCLNNACDSVIV